jgi:hypothetical protein
LDKVDTWKVSVLLQLLALSLLLLALLVLALLSLLSEMMSKN